MPMKRIWGFVFGGAVMAVGGALALPACAHDDSTIFVQSVLAPQLVTPGTGCAFSADPTQETISRGVLDISLRPTYEASFLLANQLVPRGNPTTPTTETSYVNIKGAVIRITDSSGVQLNTFTRLGSVVIPPSSGTTPGFAALAGLTIIDEGTAANAGATFQNVPRVVVYTKFFGNTLGGQYVESDEFEFPVDICNGCLVGFSQSDISPNCQNVNCLGNAGSMPAAVQIPCDLEDFGVDCSACRGFDSLCNPTCIPVIPDSGAVTDAGAGGG
jgi:hypothetical protein